LGTNLSGQTTVVSNDYLANTRSDEYIWTINGVKFSPSKEKIHIFPNYPAIDTIIFHDSNYSRKHDSIPDTIYTRIPKDREYQMTVGCCDSYFDIYELKNIQNRISLLNSDSLSDEEFDSISIASKESGEVRFIIKNMPKGDTLICLYTDFSGMPYGQMILKNGSYGWFSPSKGYYSNSNDFIVFAKKKTSLEFTKEDGNTISWDSPDFNEYFDKFLMFGVRIFNKERVTVEFDYITRKTKLKFEKKR